jgi:hypothetical protein
VAHKTHPKSPASLLLDGAFHHTPAKSREEFDRIIDGFLTKCLPRVRELVENANHVPSFLPSWELGPSADENLAKHISELCIPTVSGGRPSLLLHDLGEERKDLDKDRIARIPNIFSFAYHTYVT